jgi:hypothetical protein
VTVTAKAATSRNERRVCGLFTLLVVLCIVMAQLLLAADGNYQSSPFQVPSSTHAAQYHMH